MVDDSTDDVFPFRPHDDLVVVQRQPRVVAVEQYLLLANTFEISILAGSI
jgi:hypothetical protein